MKMNYHKTIGTIMNDYRKKVGWTADELARVLTIQCYKNLPKSDLANFPLQDELASYKINLNRKQDSNCKISDYINNKHKESNSVIIISEDSPRSLDHAITKHTVTDYLNGRTAVPILVLISFCQIFNISIEDFMAKVYEKNEVEWKPPQSDQLTAEQIYNNCLNKVFSETKDDRYVFDANIQKSLFYSLLLEGKNETKLHFTYLPRKLGLRAVKDQKEVIYQRGELTFVLKDGICHVTSKIEVSSQGVPTEYRGVAIITNPKSSGPACTCFLKEINNSFGIFIVFSFRLSSIEKPSKRKTRISECIAVRKDDGTSYVYRLLLSKNFIDDEKMKFFVGHLKLGTSENTIKDHESNILIMEKYINTAKKYFQNLPSDESPFERNVYEDLKKHFSEGDKKEYVNLIEKIEQSSLCGIERVRIVNPKIFNQESDNYLLLLGWLGKCGLSARMDKVGNKLDDYVENIHKKLYPTLHENPQDDGIFIY